MTGSTTQAASEKFVRDLLARGRSLQFISDASGWPLDKIQRIADERAGGSINLPETPAAATPPPITPATTLEEKRAAAQAVVQPRPEFKQRATNAVELLARADAITDKRIQAALGRARKAMTDLAGLVTRYEEQASARARIDELEQELRAARAALRPNGAKKSTAAKASTQDSKAIRAWAAANGVECPSVGLVPKRVVEAYEAAQVPRSA